MKSEARLNSLFEGRSTEPVGTLESADRREDGREQVTINETPTQSKASAKKLARKIDEDDYDESDEDDSSNMSPGKCRWTGRRSW